MAPTLSNGNWICQKDSKDIGTPRIEIQTAKSFFFFCQTYRCSNHMHVKKCSRRFLSLFSSAYLYFLVKNTGRLSIACKSKYLISLHLLMICITVLKRTAIWHSPVFFSYVLDKYNWIIFEGRADLGAFAPC